MRKSIFVNLKESGIGFVRGFPVFKSYLGKRTDQVGYSKLINRAKQKGAHFKLTQSERNEAKKLWGTILPQSALGRGWNFYEMVKACSVFDPQYLPSAWYMPYVFEKLNYAPFLETLAHKCLHGFFFKGCNQPKMLVGSIAGILFDEFYKVISLEKAIQILKRGNFIFKPATDSSMGRGIKLFPIPMSANEITTLIGSSKSDFIIQEVVDQSDSMKALNPSSLNCMRITTLNINGLISPTNLIVKIGAKGQIVDNIGAGSGGMMVGLTKDGHLKDFGCRVDGSYIGIEEGFAYAGMQIPNFEEVLKFAVKCHAVASSMGVIGWDIALDKNNHPVLIEGNSYWPGITIEQICAGPIFGERTLELVKYIQHIVS